MNQFIIKYDFYLKNLNIKIQKYRVKIFNKNKVIISQTNCQKRTFEEQTAELNKNQYQKEMQNNFYININEPNLQKNRREQNNHIGLIQEENTFNQDLQKLKQMNKAMAKLNELNGYSQNTSQYYSYHFKDQSNINQYYYPQGQTISDPNHQQPEYYIENNYYNSQQKSSSGQPYQYNSYPQSFHGYDQNNERLASYYGQNFYQKRQPIYQAQIIQHNSNGYNFQENINLDSAHQNKQQYQNFYQTHSTPEQNSNNNKKDEEQITTRPNTNLVYQNAFNQQIIANSQYNNNCFTQFNRNQYAQDKHINRQNIRNAFMGQIQQGKINQQNSYPFYGIQYSQNHQNVNNSVVNMKKSGINQQNQIIQNYNYSNNQNYHQQLNQTQIQNLNRQNQGQNQMECRQHYQANQNYNIYQIANSRSIQRHPFSKYEQFAIKISKLFNIRVQDLQQIYNQLRAEKQNSSYQIQQNYNSYQIQQNYYPNPNQSLNQLNGNQTDFNKDFNQVGVASFQQNSFNQFNQKDHQYPNFQDYPNQQPYQSSQIRAQNFKNTQIHSNRNTNQLAIADSQVMKQLFTYALQIKNSHNKLKTMVASIDSTHNSIQKYKAHQNQQNKSKEKAQINIKTKQLSNQNQAKIQGKQTHKQMQNTSINFMLQEQQNQNLSNHQRINLVRKQVNFKQQNAFQKTQRQNINQKIIRNQQAQNMDSKNTIIDHLNNSDLLSKKNILKTNSQSKNSNHKIPHGNHIPIQNDDQKSQDFILSEQTIQTISQYSQIKNLNRDKRYNKSGQNDQRKSTKKQKKSKRNQRVNQKIKAITMQLQSLKRQIDQEEQVEQQQEIEEKQQQRNLYKQEVRPSEITSFQQINTNIENQNRRKEDQKNKIFQSKPVISEKNPPVSKPQYKQIQSPNHTFGSQSYTYVKSFEQIPAEDPQIDKRIQQTIKMKIIKSPSKNSDKFNSRQNYHQQKVSRNQDQKEESYEKRQNIIVEQRQEKSRERNYKNVFILQNQKQINLNQAKSTKNRNSIKNNFQSREEMFKAIRQRKKSSQKLSRNSHSKQSRILTEAQQKYGHFNSKNNKQQNEISSHKRMKTSNSAYLEDQQQNGQVNTLSHSQSVAQIPSSSSSIIDKYQKLNSKEKPGQKNHSKEKPNAVKNQSISKLVMKDGKLVLLKEQIQINQMNNQAHSPLVKQKNIQQIRNHKKTATFGKVYEENQSFNQKNLSHLQTIENEQRNSIQLSRNNNNQNSNVSILFNTLNKNVSQKHIHVSGTSSAQNIPLNPIYFNQANSSNINTDKIIIIPPYMNQQPNKNMYAPSNYSSTINMMPVSKTQLLDSHFNNSNNRNSTLVNHSSIYSARTIQSKPLIQSQKFLNFQLNQNNNYNIMKKAPLNTNNIHSFNLKPSISMAQIPQNNTPTRKISMIPVTNNQVIISRPLTPISKIQNTPNLFHRDKEQIGQFVNKPRPFSVQKIININRSNFIVNPSTIHTNNKINIPINNNIQRVRQQTKIQRPYNQRLNQFPLRPRTTQARQQYIRQNSHQKLRIQEVKRQNKLLKKQQIPKNTKFQALNPGFLEISQQVPKKQQNKNNNNFLSSLQSQQNYLYQKNKLNTNKINQISDANRIHQIQDSHFKQVIQQNNIKRYPALIQDKSFQKNINQNGNLFSSRKNQSVVHSFPINVYPNPQVPVQQLIKKQSNFDTSKFVQSSRKMNNDVYYNDNSYESKQNQLTQGSIYYHKSPKIQVHQIDESRKQSFRNSGYTPIPIQKNKTILINQSSLNPARIPQHMRPPKYVPVKQNSIVMPKTNHPILIQENSSYNEAQSSKHSINYKPQATQQKNYKPQRYGTIVQGQRPPIKTYTMGYLLQQAYKNNQRGFESSRFNQIEKGSNQAINDSVVRPRPDLLYQSTPSFGNLNDDNQYSKTVFISPFPKEQSNVVLGQSRRSSLSRNSSSSRSKSGKKGINLQSKKQKIQSLQNHKFYQSSYLQN